MKKWYEKTKYRSILLSVLALISLAGLALFIEKSTEHEVETIYVDSLGAQTTTSTEVRVLLSDSNNEPLKNALVKIDDEDTVYQTDATGYVILKNLTYGDHILHIVTNDGKQFDYPFSMSIDLDLTNACKITWTDKPNIGTPTQVKQLMFQLVLENGSFFLTEDTIIVKETGTMFLSDGTEMLPDGRIYFPSGCKLENGVFYYKNGESRKVGNDLLFTEDGVVVFPDGSFLPESRAFYLHGDSVRIIGDRSADLHNGYIKDSDGAVADEEGNRIMPDGSVVFADGVEVPSGKHTFEEAKEEAEEIRENQKESGKKTEEIEETKEEEETKESETKESEAEKPAENGTSEPKIDPASVEEYSNQTWVQASKLHIFSDSEELTGGAFKDENGQLVIAPGSRGTYHFRIATKNQRVSFILKLYHAGSLSIPVKMQLVYPNGNTSEWFSLKDCKDAQTALSFEEAIVPSNTYSYYAINWWWDENVDDVYDTAVGIQAARELTEYAVYAVLQVTTE